MSKILLKTNMRGNKCGKVGGRQVQKVDMMKNWGNGKHGMGGGTLCACACAWTWAYMHGEDTHGHRVGLTWDKDYA